MLKKLITFEDFNGDTVTEEHFFHLSKADLIELEMGQKGGLSAMLEQIIQEEDSAAIIREFKRLILASYGRKSPDGKRFIKNQEMRDEFLSTEAYSTLFLELCTNAGAAAEFVNGIVPRGFDSEMQALRAKAQATATDTVKTPPEVEVAEFDPPAPPKQRVLTRTEVLEMDHAELSHLLATGQAIIG